MNDQRTVAAAVLVVIGIVALVVGVIYLTVEAQSLPSILGQLHGISGHRSARGIGAVIVGVVLLVAGFLLARKPHP
jgi:amino acid permease